jgi:hypothetical protein
VGPPQAAQQDIFRNCLPARRADGSVAAMNGRS